MRKLYRNTLDLGITPDPLERRQNISKEIIRHADFLPKPLTYEDIDRSFKEWVENIEIIQDGKKLPTMVLYSNQRFSEYMQTWQYTDENNNVRLNFKTVTRENNPGHGTILGDTYNIPGNRFYTLRSINALDESGKKYRIDYKMRQPSAVDLKYKVSIMTNRYVVINEFNEIVNRLFNAMQSYICPNGHYMSIILDNFSDESEYNISDRQFFSQSFNVTVKGYIIREEDLRVEENPVAAVICFEGDTGKRRKPTVELAEYEPCFIPEESVYEKPIDIDISLFYCKPCLGKVEFTMDENFTLTDIVFRDDECNNVEKTTIQLFINNELKTNDLVSFIQEEEVTFSESDVITIQTNRLKKYINDGYISLKGYNTIVIPHKDAENPDLVNSLIEPVMVTKCSESECFKPNTLPIEGCEKENALENCSK